MSELDPMMLSDDLFGDESIMINQAILLYELRLTLDV